MPETSRPARHARLFELIRQQRLADTRTPRAPETPEPRLPGQVASRFRDQADRSLRATRPDRRLARALRAAM